VSTPDQGTISKSLQPASAAVPFLTKAIAQMESEDGWVGLGAVGQRLANIASDFDPRTYGFRKLSDLIRKTGAFDMEQPDGRTVRIRAKAPSRRPRQAAPDAPRDGVGDGAEGPRPPRHGHNRRSRGRFAALGHFARCF